MQKPLINALLLLLVFLSGRAAAETGQILVIESYHPHLAWTALCEKGIQSVLGAEYEIAYFYMDTKNVPESEFSERADLAWEKYSDMQPNLVMIGDDNALRLLGPRFSKTETPVVYFGINNNPRYYFDRVPRNVSGILERTPVIPWTRYLCQIMPDARKALILMDSSPTSKAIIDIVFQERKTVTMGGLEIEYKTTGDWAEWKDIVLNPNDYNLIVMPTFYSVKDQTGRTLKDMDVIGWTAANSTIPTFTNQSYTVGSKGVAGAYYIQAEKHGRIAAEIALNILHKKSSTTDFLYQTDSDGQFCFNREQLDRFKIKLPQKIEEQAVFR